MARVVINCCFGGFGLSDAACNWLRENRGYPANKLDASDIDDLRYAFGSARHHPDLLAVIDALGEAAEGDCASLRIVDIPEGLYRIDGYDGAESVETPDSMTFEYDTRKSAEPDIH